MKQIDQAELSEESWRIIGDLIHTGKATLSDGSEFAPMDKDLVGLFRWVAGLKKERSRDVPLPEDFLGVKHGQDDKPQLGGEVEGPPDPV